MGATGPLVSVMCIGYYRSGFKIVNAIANSNFKVLISVLDAMKLNFLLIKALFSITLTVNLVHCKLLFFTIHRYR